MQSVEEGNSWKGNKVSRVKPSSMWSWSRPYDPHLIIAVVVVVFVPAIQWLIPLQSKHDNSIMNTRIHSYKFSGAHNHVNGTTRQE